jgi:hypothetical protein
MDVSEKLTAPIIRVMTYLPHYTEQHPIHVTMRTSNLPDDVKELGKHARIYGNLKFVEE